MAGAEMVRLYESSLPHRAFCQRGPPMSRVSRNLGFLRFRYGNGREESDEDSYGPMPPVAAFELPEFLFNVLHFTSRFCP